MWEDFMPVHFGNDFHESLFENIILLCLHRSFIVFSDPHESYVDFCIFLTKKVEDFCIIVKSSLYIVGFLSINVFPKSLCAVFLSSVPAVCPFPGQSSYGGQHLMVAGCLPPVRPRLWNVSCSLSGARLCPRTLLSAGWQWIQWIHVLSWLSVVITLKFGDW